MEKISVLENQSSTGDDKVTLKLPHIHGRKGKRQLQ